MAFSQYRLTAERLYLGERQRGALFKPTARTIPYSQITGALRVALGRTDIKACGVLVGPSGQAAATTTPVRTEYLTYAPRDDVQGISKVPLTVEYLTDVEGTVFVRDVPALPNDLELTLGGMRSSGFGRCRLSRTGPADTTPSRGLLNTRLPLTELETFGVTPVRPRHGYLFKPDDSREHGQYVLALFEGSLVDGPAFAIEKGR